jgi:hypothetical protein
VALAIGHFENNDKTTNIDETNIIIGYNMSDKSNIEFIHTVSDNKGAQTDAATNFSRQLARLTYAF